MGGRRRKRKRGSRGGIKRRKIKNKRSYRSQGEEGWRRKRRGRCRRRTRGGKKRRRDRR